MFLGKTGIQTWMWLACYNLIRSQRCPKA